ncbi:MAG: hypothetical protein K9H16_13460 [Bacteroidales bacterium]|nr:hypothetical protein [Bacteroidales bacterium]
MKKQKTRHSKLRLREWLHRYLIAEIISSVLSLSAAFFVKHRWDQDVAAAFAASLVASVSFYGWILFKDVQLRQSHLKNENLSYTFRLFLHDIRNLLVEFGPAEILDLAIVRPFSMYIFPILINDFMLGTLIGKIIADILFYIPAIFMYELRKKYF